MIFTKKQKKWTIVHWENQILTDIPGDSEQKTSKKTFLNVWKDYNSINFVIRLEMMILGPPYLKYYCMNPLIMNV